MSDLTFLTEKTESSGKQSQNNNKFRKGTTYTKGATKMAGKRACAQLGQKSKERHLVDN